PPPLPVGQSPVARRPRRAAGVLPPRPRGREVGLAGHLSGRPVKVSLCIPFRDATGERTPQMEWIVARWRHHWPDAEVIIRPDDGRGPFSKSVALQSCAAAATGDVLILLDADTWCDVPTIQHAIEVA